MAVSIDEGDGCSRGSPILRGGEQGGISLPLFSPSWPQRLGGEPEVAPGGRPSRIMRVERVEGATWEEAMPPLAPSDRSPTATPELNCSTIWLELPPIASTFLALCLFDFATRLATSLNHVSTNEWIIEWLTESFERCISRHTKNSYLQISIKLFDNIKRKSILLFHTKRTKRNFSHLEQTNCNRCNLGSLFYI